MKYDFCCVGSALVDITFQIDDDFVLKNEKRGIPKGAMTLIDKEVQIKIIEELKVLEKFQKKHVEAQQLTQLWPPHYSVHHVI